MGLVKEPAPCQVLRRFVVVILCRFRRSRVWSRSQPRVRCWGGLWWWFFAGSDGQGSGKGDGHHTGRDAREEQSRCWSPQVRHSRHWLLWCTQRSQTKTWKGTRTIIFVLFLKWFGIGWVHYLYLQSFMCSFTVVCEFRFRLNYSDISVRRLSVPHKYCVDKFLLHHISSPLFQLPQI